MKFLGSEICFIYFERYFYANAGLISWSTRTRLSHQLLCVEIYSLFPFKVKTSTSHYLLWLFILNKQFSNWIFSRVLVRLFRLSKLDNPYHLLQRFEQLKARSFNPPMIVGSTINSSSFACRCLVNFILLYLMLDTLAKGGIGSWDLGWEPNFELLCAFGEQV